MSESEGFLRSFHARWAGATSRAFARTGSYARLASLVAAHIGVRGNASGIGGDTRVLDLACGDHVMAGAIGVDLSLDELLAATKGAVPIGGLETTGSFRVRRVQARAQSLPFREGAFDAVVCHLAFMLFDDVERVVTELARVLAPGGVFAALLGGGPVEFANDAARGRDAFHRFLAIGAPHFRSARFGDPRTKSERGWRELFVGWSEPTFERVELELGGTFDDAWSFLGASYQLDPAHADRVRDELHAELGDRASCKVVCWLASVRR